MRDPFYTTFSRKQQRETAVPLAATPPASAPTATVPTAILDRKHPEAALGDLLLETAATEGGTASPDSAARMVVSQMVLAAAMGIVLALAWKGALPAAPVVLVAVIFIAAVGIMRCRAAAPATCPRNRDGRNKSLIGSSKMVQLVLLVSLVQLVEGLR